MITIDISEEMYKKLQKLAISFVEKTPEDVLTRVVRFYEANTPNEGDSNHEEVKINAFVNEPQPSGIHRNSHTKRPRTKYQELEKEGSLSQGQTLNLHDYQGNRIPNEMATYENGELRVNGRLDSFSNHARERLAANGIRTKAARGPKHWANEEGLTVESMWNDFLERNPGFSY